MCRGSRPEPACCGEQRSAVHDRRIHPRCPISKAHIARPGRKGIINQSFHVVERRIANRMGHFDAKGAQKVLRACVDEVALANVAPACFARDEALVNFRTARQDDAIY